MVKETVAVESGWLKEKRGVAFVPGNSTGDLFDW